MGLQATFIALHLICFILNIPPLIWHSMCKNIPAITLLVYLEVMMINGLVGAIVWGGQGYFSAWDGKGWCDIMIRFQLAVSVGISSTISCISFNLLMIFLTNRMTTFWFGNKWIKPTTEIFFSIIFPFIISGISYFAQSSRYVINQFSGCSVILTTESISILVFYVWIFFWCFVGLVISLTTLVLYYLKRKAAKEILVCTNSGLSVRRFIRLLSYCILVIIAAIVFSAIIGSNLNIKPHSFYDKDVIHNSSWGFIFKVPHVDTVDTNKWVLIAISLVSFFLFGIGEDAKIMYVSILNKLPFGEFVINKCEFIKEKIGSLLGNSLISYEAKYIGKFWSSGDGDDYSDTKDEESSIEMCSFKKDECLTAFSDGGFSFKEDFKEFDVTNSPTTLRTVGTSRDSLFRHDEHLQAELLEAERQLKDDDKEGSNKDIDDDEFKYLYY